MRSLLGKIRERMTYAEEPAAEDFVNSPEVQFEPFTGFHPDAPANDAIPEIFSLDMTREQMAAFIERAAASGKTWKLGGQGPLD